MPESLCRAIECGNLDLVRTRIGPHNVNDRMRDDCSCIHETPLIDACYYKQVHIVRYLIDAGADVNIKTAGGTSPLWMALSCTVTDDATLLLELLRVLVEEGGARVDDDDDDDNNNNPPSRSSTLEYARRALADHVLSPAKWNYISVGIEFLESRIPMIVASSSSRERQQRWCIHPQIEDTGRKQVDEIYKEILKSFHGSSDVAFHTMSFLSIGDVDVPIIVPSKESLEKYPEWLSVDRSQDSQSCSTEVEADRELDTALKKRQNEWASSSRVPGATALIRTITKKLKSMFKAGKQKMRRK